MKDQPYNVLRHVRQWERAPRAGAAAGYVASALFASGTIGYYAVYAAVYVGVTLVASYAMRALAPKPKMPSSALGSEGVLVNNKDAIAPHDIVYGQVRKGGTITYYETTGPDNKYLHQIIALAGHAVEEIGDIYINDQIAPLEGDEDIIEYEFQGPPESDFNITGFGFGDKIFKFRVRESDAIYNVSDNVTLTDLLQFNLNKNIGANKDEINTILGQLILFVGNNSSATATVNARPVVGNLGGSVQSGPYRRKVRIKKYIGTDTQVVDPDLLSESNQIDANFRGRGIAYLYVRYEYDRETFANGIPLITAVVKGKNVYDPRTDTTAYSNNAALCVRDYLTSAYGLNDDQVDDTAFAAAANICDENVDRAFVGLPPQNRYDIDGITRTDISHGEVLDEMMTACAGTLFWGAGKWKLVVGDYVAPTKNLTLDDLRGPISLATKVNLRDQFNVVQGTFNSKADRWITTDYPRVVGQTFVSQDGGEEQSLDLQLPFTTDSAAAQRLAKLTLYRGREQLAFSADFGLNAFDVEVGEIITLTNERYGWNQKEFEVVGWSFNATEENGLTVNLNLREISEAAFNWNAEEKELIQNNTSLPSPFVTPPVSLSFDGELRVANQQVVGALLIDVSSSSPFAERFEVEYKESTSLIWKTAGQASDGRFEAIGVSDGLFDVRARSINVFGARGDYNTIFGQYISLFEEEPEDVTNFAANVVGNTLHLSWTPVGDLDLSHYKVRYSPLTSGASYNNAIDVIKKISRPANSVTLPSKTGTYFIKAVDKLGNPSNNAASVLVQTNVADLDNLNFIENIVEHPSFTGAKSDVVLLSDETGPYITLDTSTLFDSVTGDFDDATGLFDGGGGSTVASTGTYQFHDYIDLGAKYVSRVQADLDVDFLDYANTFDSAAGLFDAREGNFDGDPTQFDTISARTQVSFTDDDPAGSPTWSAWQDFFVGDIAARAIRFRAILETSDGNNAPAVRELSVEVDMPDRIEADDDITYTGSKVVTFPSAFKVTPAIGIAASLADGDRYVISGKSRTGFTITTYTGASVSSNPVTFDYVAKGYGKELSA